MIIWWTITLIAGATIFVFSALGLTKALSMEPTSESRAWRESPASFIKRVALSDPKFKDVQVEYSDGFVKAVNLTGHVSTLNDEFDAKSAVWLKAAGKGVKIDALFSHIRTDEPPVQWINPPTPGTVEDPTHAWNILRNAR